MMKTFTIAASALALACTTSSEEMPRTIDEEVRALVQRSEQGNDALLRGDVDRYRELIRLGDDFLLMSPFGGKPTSGSDPERLERLRTFFKNGFIKQELVDAWATPDMIVLATIERGRGEVGGLPAQDWALRVTQVYRRVSGSWQLAHRHADPLAHGISIAEAGVLGRGERIVAERR